MKVLVATHTGQGEQEGDYCWTVDGELVSPVVLECSDGEQCGCRRGFPGFASSRATTTALVVDLEHIGEVEFVAAVTDYLTNAGWLTGLCEQQRQEEIADEIEAIAEVASSFPVGTVIRREGDHVYVAGRRAA
jgi:hypothetical protein